MKLMYHKHGKIDRFLGVDLFDNAPVDRGGHSHWLYNLINNRLVSKFMWIEYCIIGINIIPNISIYSTWYDGQHHNIHLGFFVINWGGSPHKKYCRFDLNQIIEDLIWEKKKK